MHNGGRRADIDNNISEIWLHKQILLCIAQSVSQILLESFILAWAPLACSNTMAALCSTLWPQSVAHKKVLAHYRASLFLSHICLISKSRHMKIMSLDCKHSVCTYIKDSSVTLSQFCLGKRHVRLQHSFLSCDVPFNVL